MKKSAKDLEKFKKWLVENEMSDNTIGVYVCGDRIL